MSNRRATHRALALLGLCWALGTPACSLTLDFQECQEDDDCRQIGAGLTCSSEGFCVDFDEPECSVDNDCLVFATRTRCAAGACVEPGDRPDTGEPDMGPQMDVDAPDADEPCTAARCIEQKGDNHICSPEGACVAILTPECNTIVGPIDREREDIFLIGSVLPTTGQFGGLGLPIQQAAELAAVELNDASALPNGRRVVMVGCDSGGVGAQGLAAVRHLVEDLGVQAIVGPAFSSIFIEASTTITVPAGVMTISPSATSPTISDLEDDGLAWRTVASDLFQGVAIGDLLLEQGHDRVIALHKGEAYGRGLRDRVVPTVSTALGEEGLLSLEYADPGQGAVDVGVVVSAFDEFPDADVLVLLGTTEVLDLLLAAESIATDRVLPPPRYLLTDGGRDGDRFQELFDSGQFTEELLSRIEGTEPDHQNGAIFTTFDIRFRSRYQNQPAGVFTANAYDAVYLLAYATLTAGGDTPISGHTLAAGMTMLSDLEGLKLEVGPSTIAQARTALGGGGTINFEGASGRLDFDLSKGEAPANVSLWRPSIRNGDVRFDSQRRYTIGDDGAGQWDSE